MLVEKRDGKETDVELLSGVLTIFDVPAKVTEIVRVLRFSI